MSQPSDERIRATVGDVCDLLTEKGVSTIDGEIALLQVVATSIATKVYSLQAAGSRITEAEALEPYLETLTKLYRLNMEEMLEKGFPSDRSGPEQPQEGNDHG